VGGGVQLGPLGTAATNRPIVPAPGDYGDGEIGGMIGRENRSTRRKPAPSGRAVAQAFSRWLSTAAARVRARAACGVCGGQSGTGAGFLRVLRFPYQSFHQFLHHHNHPGLAQ
jgi:hypothetical protein